MGDSSRKPSTQRNALPTPSSYVPPRVSPFSNIKSVLIDRNSGKIEANWYPYTAVKYRLFDAMTKSLFSRGLAAFARFALTGMKLEGYSAKVSKQGREK